MKSHIQKKSIQFAEEPLKKIVKQLFNEYLSFISYPNIEFPENVIIKIFNGFQSVRHNFGTLQTPSNEKEPYILHLEQFVVATKSKEIIYHEFTHVMDDVIINNHISFEDRLHNIKFITEVRARYIEYLFRSNFKNIKDDKLLNADSILLSDIVNKPISLQSEVEKYNNKIINDINVYLSDNFFGVMQQVYYYIGFINFAERHSNIIIDTSPIIEKLSTILGDNIQYLFDSRKIIPLDFRPINKSILLEVGTIVNKMYQYYRDNHLR